MTKRLFGTDGVRGIANRELSCDLALRLAYSAAHTLFEKKAEKNKVLIGHDTRISSSMLEAALVAGFTMAGVDVYLAGVVPTPAVAYLVTKYACDMGVVISASHNSYEYNGIKLFNQSGYKLPDEIEDVIEANMKLFDEEHARPRPVAGAIGRSFRLNDAAEEYRKHLISLAGLDLTGKRLVLDAANGAAFEIAPSLFSALGAELHVVGDKPNGLNINLNCGSTHVENIAELVTELGYDGGLAFDGDADRLIAVDEKGGILDGDVTLSILAKFMLDRGVLKDNTLVVTVMSNLGLDKMAEREGIRLVKTQVGDRYVLEEMLRGNYKLGGEQSGHIIFLDDSTSGDGILSALRLLDVSVKSGKSLSELREVLTLYPQVLINVPVPNEYKTKVLEDPDVLLAGKRVEEELGDNGRLLLRPSGTEAYVRVMLEGKEQKYIQSLAEGLAKLISSRFTY